MNEIERKINVTPYEADYAQWCAEQGALLRAGKLDAIDRANLAEEIESLGRSDQREIRTRMEVLMRHLLKWQFQPEKRKSGWQSTIMEQRVQINALLEDSSSLRGRPKIELLKMYPVARMKAHHVTELPISTFPELPTFTTEQALDHEFLPASSNGDKTL